MSKHSRVRRIAWWKLWRVQWDDKWLGHISTICCPHGCVLWLRTGFLDLHCHPNHQSSGQRGRLGGCCGVSTLLNMFFSMSTSFLSVSMVALTAQMSVSKSCKVFMDWRGREKGKTWSWVWLGEKASKVEVLWWLPWSKKASWLSQGLGCNILRGQQMTPKSAVLWALRWPGWEGHNPVLECIQQPGVTHHEASHAL